MSENSSQISGVHSDPDEVYLAQSRAPKVRAALKEQNWGKDKKKYYKEQDSEDSNDEAVEAEELQGNQQSKLRDEDYWDVHSEESVEQVQSIIQTKYNQYALESLSETLNLDQKQLIALKDKAFGIKMKEAWPELEAIIAEIDESGKAIRTLKKTKSETAIQRKYSQMNLKLQSTYTAVLLFYLQLRSHTKLSENHPIFKKITDLREAIAATEEVEKHVDFLAMHELTAKQRDISEDDSAVSQGEQIENQNENLKIKQSLQRETNKSNKKVDRVRRVLEDMDVRKQVRFADQQDEKQSIASDLIKDVLSDDDGEDEFYKQNQDRVQESKQQKKKQKIIEKQQQFQQLNTLQKPKEVDENDPRKITYVMMKNISLMRRKRGQQQKNSRVKHKLRYESALKKLKSQNKFMKDPKVSNYAGENGIKSGIVRGVKLQ